MLGFENKLIVTFSSTHWPLREESLLKKVIYPKLESLGFETRLLTPNVPRLTLVLTEKLRSQSVFEVDMLFQMLNILVFPKK